MIRSLKVNKVNHPVSLSFDEEGLRIEGDFNAAKNCKKKKIVTIIPIPLSLLTLSFLKQRTQKLFVAYPFLLEKGLIQHCYLLITCIF